ncbi:MAG: hypothetical protein R3B35_09570 [Gemmatimonadales bacterium]
MFASASLSLLASLASAQFPPVPPAPPAVVPTVRVTVDSSARTVTISAGPYEVPGMPMPDHHADDMPTMMMDGHAGVGEPLLDFTWPLDGWVHGAALTLIDADGKAVPRRLVHHINLVNFARRQLLYTAPERLLAMGRETEDIALPSSIGIPVASGMPMGLVLMWHNMSMTDYHGVTVSLTLDWLPTNYVPRPASVLPLYMNVINPVGRAVDLDLPAGRQSFAADFAMPLDGRILGVGGHLHDHGTGLRLDEVRGDGSRKEILSLETERDSAGTMLRIERKLPGVTGRGIKLSKGRTYRMTGSYDNPTGRVLKGGAMVHLIGLFRPDDMADWPAIDPNDPSWRKDMAFLRRTN